MYLTAYLAEKAKLESQTLEVFGSRPIRLDFDDYSFDEASEGYHIA
jgi:hypothetical protein